MCPLYTKSGTKVGSLKFLRRSLLSCLPSWLTCCFPNSVETVQVEDLRSDFRMHGGAIHLQRRGYTKLGQTYQMALGEAGGSEVEEFVNAAGNKWERVDVLGGLKALR
ncbi:hypothetical protein B0J14DRAFT_569010 [Halenospora varia]|nr:hypothetical protein B0J14DRAFT_569010 [Halenospora varia]